MKYNGKELEEITQAQWDGRTREMLVWNDYDADPILALVCGFALNGHPIADVGNYTAEASSKSYVAFQYCADIPEDSYITDKMSSAEIIEKFKRLRSELKQWLKNNEAGNLLVNNLQYGIKTALNLTDVNHHFIDVLDFSNIDTNVNKNSGND